MVTKEKLYEAFGELLYAVAKADGLVQDEEMSTLKNLLQNHAWASEIQWSFNYEKGRGHSVDFTYKKAIDIFKEHGPDPEYARFVEILRLVGDAHAGMDDSEKQVIEKFQQDLLAQFQQDIDKISQDS
jgi:uncharacterized tellurite resistance protein B-like protein